MIIETEHFKRQEHAESIDKCKKNKGLLTEYNTSSISPAKL